MDRKDTVAAVESWLGKQVGPACNLLKDAAELVAALKQKGLP